MKKLIIALSTGALMGSLAAPLFTEKADAAEKKTLTPINTAQTFIAANNLPVTVKVIGPVQAAVDLQIICLFKHKPLGDTYIEALDDLDKHLNGAIRALRNREEFMGNLGETILMTPPANSIPAKRLLIIGLGDEKTVTADTMKEVGVIALRTSQHLGVTHIAYAPTIRDQGNSKIPTGQVADAVMTGVIAAYDTQKRMEKENLTTPYTISQWIFEAGQKFYTEVSADIGKTVQRETARISARPYTPYMTTAKK